MKRIGLSSLILAFVLFCLPVIDAIFFMKLTFTDLTGYIVFGSILSFSLAGFIILLLKLSGFARKKLINNIAIVSSSLAIMSLIFRSLHFPYAGSFMIIGIVLYSFLFAPVYFREKFLDRKQKMKSTRQAFLFSLFDFIGIIILPFGILFKMMHWPYANALMLIGAILFSVLFAPFYFKDKYLKWKQYTTPRDAFILCLFDFLGIVILVFGILFKVLHWPYAGFISLVGLVIIAVGIFSWNQKFKKEIIFRKQAEDKLNETLLEIIERNHLIEEKNNTLKQQNEEIKTINEALNEQQRLIKEKNAELEAQNEEISAQRDLLSKSNKSIGESILYAKRIQTAVLPQQAYIDEILMDNFIMYRPRDVVSGDFYWIRQINHFIVIAAADCTGHGVPGAIMSMLGISFLNEIVQNREITRASQVLNEIRKQIKHSLKQTGREGGIEDGMDMALCVLDTKTNILQFAGANNPLYFVQNNELIEIQADKMPIGFYPNEKPTFTNHEIQLKEGDCFYLFSDGFIDQFGGEKGFKFKSANFKKILHENHGKPMQIQKERLEQELHAWMNGYEQTDDILVIGVRV